VVENNKIENYSTQQYGPFGKLYGVKSLYDKYSDVSEIVISSVLSAGMNTEIKETLLKEGVDNLYFLNPAVNSFGVELSYKDPNTLGVDRVAALIAANEKYAGNSCIIDCGTAVTVDVLDANGVHQGGVIIPGAEMMQKALLANTKIEFNDSEVEYNVLSQSTENAIHTGCVCAVIGGVEHVVNKMVSHYDGFDQIILTGGGAVNFKTHASDSFQTQVHIVENLVLDGLSVVSQNI